jgi:hypothetical protein
MDIFVVSSTLTALVSTGLVYFRDDGVADGFDGL